MIRHISPQEAKSGLHAPGEIAFLDLREAGPYSEGHPLFATHCPYSLLEVRIRELVPRLSTPLLLLDDGDGLAEIAAGALSELGFSDISVLEGGAPGWASAGLTLYQGVNVPSKTLGELVEHIWHPSVIDAQTLTAWQAENRDFSFFDCRPPAEFAKMTVPGASCLPNGELAHRLSAIDRAKPIVLTCAGRTRGVIGAAGLSRLFPGLEVYALENGTQGWRLAGFDLALGNTAPPYPDLDDEGRAQTRAKALDFLKKEGIPTVAADEVARLRKAGDRNVFLIDVRSEAEADADPLPAFRHALSGQLVQATDQWIGVRHSRVVLADDLGLRAALAAFWLKILGYEPCVALVNDDLRSLPAMDAMPPEPSVPEYSPDAALEAARSGGARLLDLRASGAFCAEHVLGATWAIRPRLRAFPIGPLYLLISQSGPKAELAARELARLGHRNVAIVAGGHAALRQAGAETGSCPEFPLSEAIDVTSFAHGRHDGDLAASRLYLSWEQGLVDQLDPDERAEFLI